MKYLAVLLLVAVPAAADADQRQRGASRPAARQEASRPAPPQSVSPRPSPQPRIGQPLVPAGWQWYVSGPRRGPQINSPLLPAGQQWFGWRGDGRRERHWQGGWYNPYGIGAGYGYGAGYPAAEYVDERYNQLPPVEVMTKGLLRLDVTPATGLQYYVDDTFFGTSQDLGLEFELNAGARHIEIRAAGYKPLAFDTRIDVGAVVSYRGALEPLTEGQARSPQATGNKTIYVIPGCYIGNAPPKAANLRKGCDIKRVTTR
jgi:hypothetical protein